MRRMTGRPRRDSGRVYLTLERADLNLLNAYAAELGKPPASLAGRIVHDVLEAGRDEFGRVDGQRVEAAVRALRGDPQMPSPLPRWRWPIEAILGDRAWWDTWYPELCRLLGRHLRASSTSSQLGSGSTPILNAEGYSDVMEFLLPSIIEGNRRVSWRSPDYPSQGEQRSGRRDDSPPLRPTWEAVIRHVVLALQALETAHGSGQASLVMVAEDQIRYSWLGTLRTLTGEEREQPALPRQRLAQV